MLLRLHGFAHNRLAEVDDFRNFRKLLHLSLEHILIEIDRSLRTTADQMISEDCDSTMPSREQALDGSDHSS